MTLSDIHRAFHIGEDEILDAKLILFEMPNPYFKHVPMKLTYKHILEEHMPEIKLR
jgi:hypothetical protein